MQSAQNVPQGSRAQSSSGPALRAPQMKRPMDVWGGPASLLTLLGDAAPSLYGKTFSHFYIGVREVDAIVNGQTIVLGSSATPYQMDLLQYQNGSTNWMTQTSVPAQTYTQLRYVIDLSSTQAIFSDGSSLPVKFSGGFSKSSAGEGGTTTTTADATYANTVDVLLNASLPISGTAAVAADFNLSESLNESNNTIIVRPVLAAAVSPGQIGGTVVNAYGGPVQGAMVVAVGSNGAAANSAATDANGAFNLHALQADRYQLLIYNSYTNAAGYKTYSAGASSSLQGFYGPTVSVTAGSTVSAGSIGD
ncbi:MAG TPA: DUF4382 domain-containing protein [Candidatus Baltobacteraceae bacterium]|nr:DUF4382 domain-containing protein [Candidatus Baltobacteraceae bacterium]